MTIIVKCEDQLREAREFAAKVGKTENLERWIGYLEHYGDDRYECELYTDFAPYSFGFSMFTRPRETYVHEQCCTVCHEKWKSEHQYTDCPACDAKGTVEHLHKWPHHVHREYVFNGGLIFHGVHDRGGDGGAPTFSVCLEPTDGWSIHT